MNPPAPLPQPIDTPGALRALARGASLVSATNSLARHLAGAYAADFIRAGIGAWDTPDILPLNAWLERCFHQLQPDKLPAPILLDGFQESLLWEQQVARSGIGRSLLRPEAAARAAMEGWERLCAWGLTLDDLGPGGNDQTRAFVTWTRGVQDRCASRGWLPRPLLPATLAGVVSEGSFPPIGQLILAGFDELPPAIARLMRTLIDRGTPVFELAPVHQETRCHRLSLADADAELVRAAGWAVRQLRNEPDARVGILLPDLAQRREQVRRTLDALLHPSSLLDVEPTQGRAYSLSVGRPLAEFPLAHDALLLLRLVTGSIDFGGLATLLRSPFVGDGEQEYDARTRLEAVLRDEPERRFRLSQVVSLCGTRCPRLRGLLERASRVNLRGSQTPSAWSGHFRALLGDLGWPGKRPLNRAEYELAERFRRLVDDFPRLGGMEPGMSAERALTLLHRLAGQTSYQPDSRVAPIQVLGLREADGLDFDALWITGLSDQVLPAGVEPHPLLPVALQRRHAMPHASAEGELASARRLLERLATSARKVMLSWPRLQDDSEQLPSPLILSFPELGEEPPGDPLDADPARRWLARQPLEHLTDTAGPPLAAGVRVRGGTQLLKDQAACPFRAFARHRLDAGSLADPTAGPSAMTHGSLLHASLHAFWAETRDQARLRELAASPGTLEKRVREAVDRGLQSLPELARTLSAAQIALETGQLTRRLLQWMTVELQRQPFAVATIENLREVSVGALELRTTADRVDRLEDGRLAVIDYKSGHVDRAGWFQDRLYEPQLPLYALDAGGDDRVAAVSFATLRADECRFVGTAAGNELLPGVKALGKDRSRAVDTDWPGLFERWRHQLEQLAAEVASGNAAVQPMLKDACTWCDLGDLCRISDEGESPDEP
ncbi:MAG: PD-(D/E)XK nuclease family protein [Pseudomonadota bacterium]